jgi:hypothetical protein
MALTVWGNYHVALGSKALSSYVGVVAATSVKNGQTCRIVSIGTTDFTLCGATSNTVGEVYVQSATIPIGTGTVTQTYDAASQVNVIPGETYTIISTGTSDFTAVGAAANTVGTVFVATPPLTNGFPSGRAVRPSDGAIAIGHNALKSIANRTLANLAVGHAALQNTIESSNNLAIGNRVLSQLETYGVGIQFTGFCTGVGAGALAKTGYANNCTALGYTAMGSAGKVISAVELVSMTGRTYRIVTVGTTDYTLVGAASNTVGVEFVCTGVPTGTGTVQGFIIENVGLGSNALLNLKSGSSCTAVGYAALVSSTFGEHNTAIGARAGFNITTGIQNTFLGSYAGAPPTGSFQNTTGYDNVFIGCRTVGAAGTDNNSIVIGTDAAGTGSNTAVIGNSAITQTTLRGKVLAGAGTSTAQPVVGGRLFVQTNSAVCIGTGNTDLVSYTLPANSLFENGSGLELHAWGYYTAISTKTIRVVLGATTLGTWAITNGASGGQAVFWSIQVKVFRTGASTQKYVMSYLSNYSGDDTQMQSLARQGSLTNIDTAAITFKIQGQGGATSEISCEGTHVSFL